MAAAFWSEEKVAELKASADAGMTASQIGALLGCSRNAVIGKLIRMKGAAGSLKQQPSLRGRPARKPGAPAPARRTRPPARPKPVAAAPAAEPEPAPPTPPATVPMRFAEAMTLDRCLHFVGDWLTPDGPDMPVCGAERSLSAYPIPYCARHARSSVAGEAA